MCTNNSIIDNLLYKDGYKLSILSNKLMVDYGNSPEHFPYKCKNLNIIKLQLNDKLLLSYWERLYTYLPIPEDLVNLIYSYIKSPIINIISNYELINNLNIFNKLYRQPRVYIGPPIYNNMIECGCGRYGEHICKNIEESPPVPILLNTRKLHKSKRKSKRKFYKRLNKQTKYNIFQKRKNCNNC